FAGGRGGPFALFDELFDFLATFLSDAFVEVRAVTVARRLAAFLSALFADLFVKLMTVGFFGGEAAFTADLFVKLRTILLLDGLTAFLAGFANRHAAGAFGLFGGR
ncbi:MAG TPA: hypothetical protein VJP76_04375, partial [Candidatus Tumulicola sp.]|nr:hypothetical protein [Candidatus Tumulicola sp.]